MQSLQEYGLNTPHSVYVVAEIGLNHNGNVDTAKRLIASAGETGVDAVKFQTYQTEKRVPRSSPIYGLLEKCERTFTWI